MGTCEYQGSSGSSWVNWNSSVVSNTPQSGNESLSAGIQRSWRNIVLNDGDRLYFATFTGSNQTGIKTVHIYLEGPCVVAGPVVSVMPSGQISWENHYILNGSAPSLPCSESNPCPEGEKCVDGECVPCDEQQATHFQIRFEYSELATDASSSQSMYHLSSIIPIASAEGLVIEGTEINQSSYFPRIRFCDVSGAIKPYTGTLSFYGFCTPDKSVCLYPSNGNLTDASTFLGSESSTDAVTHNPWFIPRILINHMDASAVIYEPDCSSVTPQEPPDIEPVIPTPPEEPEEPVEPPEEPVEPPEPLPPTPPPQPQEGLCPCEEYIGLQIKRAADILYDGLILLKRELSVIGREIVVELWEARKQQYQLSMFLQNQQYQVLQAQHQRLYEMKQELVDIKTAVEKGLVKDETGLIDCFVDETGKTINSAVQDIEPVWIENEFNVKSHIVPQGDTLIE